MYLILDTFPSRFANDFGGSSLAFWSASQGKVCVALRLQTVLELPLELYVEIVF